MSSFLWKQIPSEPVPAPVADENREEISEDTPSEANDNNVKAEVTTTGAAKDASTETEECGVCNTENEENCSDADSDDESEDDSDDDN